MIKYIVKNIILLEKCCFLTRSMPRSTRSRQLKHCPGNRCRHVVDKLAIDFNVS